MKNILLVGAVAASLFATDQRGLKPRPAPSDYRAHEVQSDLTIAATVLSQDEAKSVLSTDLKDYVVIEVGVYPADGKSVDLSSRDFALRFGEQGNIVRAAAPRAIAASNQRKNSPPPQHGSGRDITIYPTATIGVANGPDPVTGRSRGGVYTGGGVGVGVGGGGTPYPDPPRPASTDRDREVMHQELADMMLPDGQFSAPVSGYLYFPLPPKSRTTALELQYYAASGKIRVLLPALPKK